MANPTGRHDSGKTSTGKTSGHGGKHHPKTTPRTDLTKAFARGRVITDLWKFLNRKDGK